MSNIEIINNADSRVILAYLTREGISGGHFTNGTYMYVSDMIVSTTLAGFKYIDEVYLDTSDAFIIAVNSDVSMQGIMDAKNADAEERATLEDQQTRALKVATPIAEQHPDRDIIVIFYDEDVPTPLYDFLAEQGFSMQSLHKWGYGTDPKAPKIEGAHNFSNVFAFPLPNDTKPVCHDLTVHEDQSEVVKVVKLTEARSASGQPYFYPKPTGP